MLLCIGILLVHIVLVVGLVPDGVLTINCQETKKKVIIHPSRQHSTIVAWILRSGVEFEFQIVMDDATFVSACCV